MIMGFFSGKNHSAGYARDRMKLLLVSERIELFSTDDEAFTERSDTCRKKIRCN